MAESGIPIRNVAEAIGRHPDLPAASIGPDQAEAHFGFTAAFLGADVPISSDLTRATLG